MRNLGDIFKIKAGNTTETGEPTLSQFPGSQFSFHYSSLRAIVYLFIGFFCLLKSYNIGFLSFINNYLVVIGMALSSQDTWRHTAFNQEARNRIPASVLLSPWHLIYERLSVSQIDYKIVGIKFILVEILIPILKGV